VKSDFKYFGPARLFGGRFPPNGGSGFPLQTFLLRPLANQKGFPLQSLTQFGFISKKKK